MDKQTLNNEIVLCRAAVSKARVATIRKFIKNIKILKSCKKEGEKEKKLKKSERLFKKVQIMKKAKDDDIIKFALKNADLEKYIQGSKIDIRQNVFAHLAKHPAVLKKVNAIREKIPNWEVELPLLVKSLRKKKKRLELEKKESVIPNKKAGDVPKQKKLERQEEKPEKQAKVTEKEVKVVEDPKIEKVDDPFFIGKKIVPSKLLDDSTELKNRNNKVENDRFVKGIRGPIFNPKSFTAKKDSKGGEIHKYGPESEEKLHPSWAAKKVKLIKPFEGKKIKFSDE